MSSSTKSLKTRLENEKRYRQNRPTNSRADKSSFARMQKHLAQAAEDHLLGDLQPEEIGSLTMGTAEILIASLGNRDKTGSLVPVKNWEVKDIEEYSDTLHNEISSAYLAREFYDYYKNWLLPASSGKSEEKDLDKLVKNHYDFAYYRSLSRTMNVIPSVVNSMTDQIRHQINSAIRQTKDQEQGKKWLEAYVKLQSTKKELLDKYAGTVDHDSQFFFEQAKLYMHSFEQSGKENISNTRKHLIDKGEILIMNTTFDDIQDYIPEENRYSYPERATSTFNKQGGTEASIDTRDAKKGTEKSTQKDSVEGLIEIEPKARAEQIKRIRDSINKMKFDPNLTDEVSEPETLVKEVVEIACDLGTTLDDFRKEYRSNRDLGNLTEEDLIKHIANSREKIVRKENGQLTHSFDEYYDIAQEVQTAAQSMFNDTKVDIRRFNQKHKGDPIIEQLTSAYRKMVDFHSDRVNLEMLLLKDQSQEESESDEKKLLNRSSQALSSIQEESLVFQGEPFDRATRWTDFKNTVVGNSANTDATSQPDDGNENMSKSGKFSWSDWPEDDYDVEKILDHLQNDPRWNAQYWDA
ncbi:uncharacterized protein I206_106048 [Kwoniella pini CBS 10737]|uniref:Uncharacterized protein n=1 Tax=Kwoniella pini CBS 10737 TaxID=1296096 RepID=A0A1B9I0W7_9TREE|nr:uncharacterized protein I206_04871 [Kwoniella pini CBS 10737]OCF49183.1 hypothetical protein I206_04871 [Kwoniella pini CBS 10737]